jgi:hypothetical protein
MAENRVSDLSPEQDLALDELVRLLERYQTYLIARSPLAESVRPLANSAAGRARPILDRAQVAPADVIGRLDAALRIPRSDADRESALEHVEAAINELRAVLARARWQIGPAAQTPVNPVAVAAASTPKDRPAGTSRVWRWLAVGIAVGVVLGVFGTRLPRSASALNRLWVLLQPVVAAASGGAIGGLLLQEGFKTSLRKHWLALLICSLLLTSTAPTAVDAARELFAPRQAPAATVAPPAVDPGAGAPPPAAAAPEPPAKPMAAPAAEPGTIAKTPDASPVGAGGADPKEAAPSPAKPARTLSARCQELLLKQSLGEELLESDRKIMERECN